MSPKIMTSAGLVSWVGLILAYFLVFAHFIAKALLPAARQLSCAQISSRSPGRVHAVLKSTQDQDHTRLLPPHPADITDSQSLAAAFRIADVIMSLVGLLRGTREQFKRV
ncbi:hypothetical protein JVU11DRAFT_4810 [Chiua virens]|nr:hypothetical protein JVU11DRAFT_4810 [Chiua virens]